MARIKNLGSHSTWLALALITLIAFALRVWAFDRLPPGLFGDEAVEGLDALDVLAGNHGIWFHAHLGREPIYVYLVALTYHLLGVTVFATRLPALIAGLLTIPVAFLLVREWATPVFPRDRATRIAVVTTGLIAISFWHVQMTRNAHRDTLLPLVEALGYWLLWRAFRTRDWRCFAGAGAILGLAVYTYSPGRFVGVFVAVFVGGEFLIAQIARRVQVAPHAEIFSTHWRGLLLAAFGALIVMLPLGLYFAQNPAQFSRRFDSTSILDADSPALAFATSVAGNLAQFVVPGMGYQSRHYNLPGKPIFDLLIAPWFLAGVGIALTRIKLPHYRFLLLWFAVMATPAFLTADMIPKAVRVLGVAPGVFIFPALALDAALARVRHSQLAMRGVIALCLVGSALWTTYDYFVAWANLPDLPLKFDADLTEVADFIQRQPAGAPLVISQEVYRPPTLMLLGERVATSRYLERATRFKEADARAAFIVNAEATLVCVREEYTPPADWLARVAPHAQLIEQGTYSMVFQLGEFAPPQKSLAAEFNPLLKLIGVAQFADAPRGVALYWQATQLPAGRDDLRATLALFDARGATVAQAQRVFPIAPLEWNLGDQFVEWYEIENMPAVATQFRVELTRGKQTWTSPILSLR